MLPENTKYPLHFLFIIPSTFCSLIVLCCVLFDRTLRQTLHNHVILIILFLTLIQQLTIYPLMIHFSIQYGIWERSLIFCEIQTFLDWALYITQMILFLWTTIERHILVFHERWLVTKKNRLLIHYLPFTFLLLYCFTIYAIPCLRNR